MTPATFRLADRLIVQMEASLSTSEAHQLRAPAWFRAMVWKLDARLRRSHGVIEYTNRTDCVFRIQFAPSPVDLKLSDGTLLRVGDRTIVLHIWNEQFPEMPTGGPTMRWARMVIDSLEASLCELARHLRAQPQLGDVKAVRVDPNPADPRQRRQYAQVLAHYGFETFPSPDPLSSFERVRRLGENILISMFVLARNPAAARIDGLRRGRTIAYLSRRLLDARYGADDAAGSASR